MISDNIEYIKKTELQPHPSNPRKHQHSQLDVIKKSVEKYGFTVPLIIDEDNVILAGNGRHEAMNDDYLMPCRRVTGLSDKQKKAYLIADNKAYELGDWCEDELNALIKELDEELEGFDFDFEKDVLLDDSMGDSFSLPDGDKNPICTMTLTLHEEQKNLIEYAISLCKNNITETFGNQNANGNAVYEVVRQWAELKK